MDIVVTLPKTESGTMLEMATIYLFKQPVVYWTPNRLPSELNIGDRVYFSYEGVVSWYRIFIMTIYDPVCEMSGLVIRGLQLLLSHQTVDLKQPFKKESFQAFHYIDRVE